jgi:hypothetical protein
MTVERVKQGAAGQTVIGEGGMGDSRALALRQKLSQRV